ncbi:MAG: hypothetical protein WD377_09070 [Nitriliruptoraceae bacterium]
MAKPRTGSLERRAARSKVMIVVMAVLMVLSLVAVPLTMLFAR